MEINQLLSLLIQGSKETIYMVFLSVFFAYLIGIPVGVTLFLTDKRGILECRIVNSILGMIVNFLRSVPFIILLVAILPLTRIVAGTTIGSSATVVPLVVSAAPFIARMVESSLKEVDSGIIEASQAMGSNPWQIVFKVLLTEARPSLMIGATIAITTILGYSAMAGFTGGGGLGAIAINYGYYRYDTKTMLTTVIILVLIVQFFQVFGMKVANKIDKRIKN